MDTILFDWDGTLIDSAPYAFSAFQKTLGDFGIPIDVELYERIYSPNWYGMYKTLQLPENKWQEADDLWTRYYGNPAAPMVEGGRQTLFELSERGYCLGIVTSGSRVRVYRELDDLDLAAVFKTVVCSEGISNRKPHPEALELAMTHLGKHPEDCCYVGDSPDDVEMGKRAGVQTIGIMSRYPCRKKLAAANPDFCFRSITQLLTLSELKL